MDPWSAGLLVLVLVGLVAVVAGALYDRTRNRRRAAEVLAPPQRAIPGFRPDAPAPHYLSELQARRAPADVPDTGLGPDERNEVARQLAAPDTLVVPAGYASPAFVTDPSSGWAVLDSPAVLVCGDAVASTRELLPLLERAVLSSAPVVVVAPSMAREVQGTLEVNRIQRRVAVLVVLLRDPAQLARVAATCRATLSDRGDRQAGYLPPGTLGHCARWVGEERRSHVVPDAPAARRGVPADPVTDSYDRQRDRTDP